MGKTDGWMGWDGRGILKRRWVGRGDGLGKDMGDAWGDIEGKIKKRIRQWWVEEV